LAFSSSSSVGAAPAKATSSAAEAAPTSWVRRQTSWARSRWASVSAPRRCRTPR
jgi:hypothetical protein